MGKFHTEIRKYRIYALVLEDSVFVAKTTSPRISAVYSNHRRGRLKATWGIMDQQTPPSLHILEALECTGAEAYRHVVAWVHLLEGAGFLSVNHEGTAAASDDLSPRTEAILQGLPKEPVREILAHTRLTRPADGNLKQAKTGLFQKKPEKNVQMNLRMSPGDKKEFDRYCKTHGLRTRDALGLLLDQAAGNDTHLKQIQASHRRELETLRRDVQKRLSLATQERAEGFLAFLRPGLADYLRMISPAGAPLPAMPRKRFRQLNPGISLAYPATEGFLLLDAQAILWGSHRAKFIIGRGENGEYLQLRYYQRPLYAGLEVNTAGLWVIGCRRASDGAMEIAAAFPVPPMPDSPRKADEPRKPGLDALIRNAQRKTRWQKVSPC